MKKLVIASDSHGSASALARVVAAEPDADALIFLGDGMDDLEQVRAQYPKLRVYAVRGNCDMTSMEQDEILLPFGGVLFFCLHGHTRGVKYTLLPLAEAACAMEADVALFGHTHVPEQDTLNGVTLFNPGSVGRPLDGVARYGVALCDQGKYTLEHKEVPPLWAD